MSPWGFTKTALILVGLCGAGMIGVIPLTDSAVLAAGPAKPTISEEAQAAVAQMGKTLRADQFSFQVHTLRTYVEPSGQPLHIAHTINVVVRRPDRLTISVTGDDGSTKLFYDGKTVSLLGVESEEILDHSGASNNPGHAGDGDGQARG